jgi:hypothetical protein
MSSISNTNSITKLKKIENDYYYNNTYNYNYIYKQHIDSHNGDINIKCKFCDKHSRTLESNILHMKVNHNKDYNIYMKKINKYNDDIKTLDSMHITKLTNLITKNINIDTIKEYKKDKDENKEDPELQYIEDNKYNNLDLFADIALAYEKHK